jgi:GNAT superfamily N-acetyltransferase
MSSIVIRAGQDADLPYVLDSFWRAFSESPCTAGTPAEVLIARMRWLLNSPSWELAVAILEADSSDLNVGWVVHQPGDRPRLAWVNVRGGWRRRGIGTALLRHAGIAKPGQHVDCAFLDPDVQRWVRDRHGLRLHWRPYLPDVALLDIRAAQAAAAAIDDTVDRAPDQGGTDG